MANPFVAPPAAMANPFADAVGGITPATHVNKRAKRPTFNGNAGTVQSEYHILFRLCTDVLEKTGKLDNVTNSLISYNSKFSATEFLAVVAQEIFDMEAEERVTRNDAMNWLAKLGSRENDMLTGLAVYKGPDGFGADISQWATRNVKIIPSLEQYEDLASLLSQMAEYVTSMSFRFTERFMINHFLKDFFAKAAETEKQTTIEGGMFDENELDPDVSAF